MVFSPAVLGGARFPPGPLLVDLDFSDVPQQEFPTASGSVLPGYIASEVLLFDETSGNLVGEVGGAQLSPVGSPTQGATAVGFFDGTDMFSEKCVSFKQQTGQRFDATTSGVFDQGADSFAVLCVFRLGFDQPGNRSSRVIRKDDGATGYSLNLTAGRLNANMRVGGVSGGTSWATQGTFADDWCWHAALVVYNRTTDTIYGFVDWTDSFSGGNMSGVSGLSLANSAAASVGGLSGFAGWDFQLKYVATFEGSQVESMIQEDLDTFWKYGKVNTNPKVVYSRSGTTTSTVGHEDGFGLRVAHWFDDQLPHGWNSALVSGTTVSGMGAAFYDSVTNKCLYSQEFNNAAWTASGIAITADDTEAPDGTYTADKLAATVSGGFIESSAITVSVNDDSTASLFVKRSDAMGSDVSGRLVIYSVSNSLEEAAAAFTATSEWDRIRVNDVAASGTQSIRIELDDSSSEIYVWGAQHEEGDDTVTPYIPTTSTTVTRGDPSCTLNNPGGYTFYSSSAGELNVIHCFEYQVTNDLQTLNQARIGTPGSDNDVRTISQTRFSYPINTMYTSSGTTYTSFRNIGFTNLVDTEYEMRMRWDEFGGLTNGVYADCFQNSDRIWDIGTSDITGNNTIPFSNTNEAGLISVGGAGGTTRANSLISRVRVWNTPQED